jgi:hypothetical protein
MKTRQPLLWTMVAAAALLCAPSTVRAQSLTTPNDPSFLVAGMAQSQNRSVHSQGFGFGVKGGLLFSTLSQANVDYKNNNGYEVGVFFGGNRPGVFGVMGEVLYAKKGAKGSQGIQTLDNYYLEIPVLLRLNLGSSNKNTGAIVYAIGGPVFDVLLKSQLDGVDVKSNYESLDLGIIGGAGIEVSRFLVEGRYNWGLRNVLKASGGTTTEVKNRSFALLAGIRFN